MAGFAEGFHNDFGTSALAYFQVALRSFTDNNNIRFYISADRAGTNTFKAFFMNNAINIDFSGKVFIRIFCECNSCRRVSCNGTLHVCRTTTINLAIMNFSRKRRMDPFLFIRYRNRIHMSIKKDLLTRPFSFDASNNVAVLIDVNRIEPIGLIRFFEYFGNAIFMTGIALLLNKFLTQCNSLIFDFLVNHLNLPPHFYLFS